MAKFFGTQSPGTSVDDPPTTIGEKCYCVEKCDTTISINLKKSLPEGTPPGIGEFSSRGMIRSINIMFEVSKKLACETNGGIVAPEESCFGPQTENTSSPGGAPTGGGMTEATSNIRSTTKRTKILGSTTYNLAGDVVDAKVCSDIPECFEVFNSDGCNGSEDLGKCRKQCKISIRFARPPHPPLTPVPPPEAQEFRKECNGEDSGWKDTAREAGITTEESKIVDILEESNYFDNNDVVNEQFPATQPHGTTFGNDLAQDLAETGTEASEAICDMINTMAEKCKDTSVLTGVGGGGFPPLTISMKPCCKCEDGK